MRKLFPTIVAIASAATLAAATACTINSTTNNNGSPDGGDNDGSVSGDDGGGGDSGSTADTGAAGDSGTAADSGTSPDSGDAATEAAPAPQANLRAANWTPDSPAAGYDFCVAQHGTSSWDGPVLAQDLGDAGVLGDSGLNGLQYPTVTNYIFGLDVGTYDVEVILAGGSCGSPLATVTNLPALAANAYYTLAILGDSSNPGNDKTLTAAIFADDSTAPSGMTSVRFLNAAPSLASVDFGQGTFSSFAPLAVNVPFGAIATQAGSGSVPSDGGTDAGPTTDGGAVALDSNGYVALAPPSGAEYSAHTSQGATTDTATASNQTAAAGAIETYVLINGKTGGAAPQFLVCTGDGAQNQSTGLVSACTIVTQ